MPYRYVTVFLIMVIPAYSSIFDGKTVVGKNGEIGKSGSEDDEIKIENSKVKALEDRGIHMLAAKSS